MSCWRHSYESDPQGGRREQQMQAVQMTGSDTGETTDGDLLTRCVNGDRVAFGELFDRYSRQVYASALVLLEHAADAEDVLSETFVVFWRKRSTITLFGGSALPWLITTARNQARNTLRARRRSRRMSLDDDGGVALSVDGADAIADLRSLSRELEAELARLNSVDQHIVQLCLVEGATYDQAAQRLGLTHGSVRNRLARARLQLRRNLSPERGDR
jgi:RNA polymerase sigma factor (sigma-70 family)